MKRQFDGAVGPHDHAERGMTSPATTAGLTAVVFLLVLKLPPNAPMSWLSARLPPGT